ncbi:MAG: GNAT family N-acetyltransferase [Pseudomonadales bacterium]
MGALPSVAIRRATKADYPALVEVEREVQREVQWEVRWEVQRACLIASNSLPRDWASLGEGQHVIYLAEDDEPFGFVCAGAPLLDPGTGGAGEIVGWYVRPGYQGHGMGKKLLVRGLSVLKRREFETAIIWLPDGAERARLILEQLSFKPLNVSRTSNQGGISMVETGYRVSLDDYF